MVGGKRSAGVLVGGLGAAAGVAGGLAPVMMQRQAGVSASRPRPPLSTRLDRRGPYLILTTHRAQADYRQAVTEAKKLHPEALQAGLDPGDPELTLALLRARRPRYAL